MPQGRVAGVAASVCGSLGLRCQVSELAAVRWVRVKNSCLRESYGSLKYPEPAAGWVARARPHHAD